MTPFVSDPDLTLYVGDCLDVLRALPDGSVDCCVTSPPYWGLRDYGTEGQMGLEASPAVYVAAMIAVFGEVRRVLADHGTLWLNLGDSYTSGDRNGHGTRIGAKQGTNRASTEGHDNVRPLMPPDLKPKDLVGIPWRVAFALQADGWYLRSDIIWAKPNPMPESVTDRPTKAHEYVFLLSKGPRYFFDQEAVREPASWERWGDQTTPKYNGTDTGSGWIKPRTKADLQARSAGNRREFRGGGKYTQGQSFDNTGEVPNGTPGNDGVPPSGRNVRSVWSIATQPYADAHFATFPEELPRRCILAGCPEWVCGTCGKARERIVERAANVHPGSSHDHTEDLTGPGAQRHANGIPAGTIMRERHEAGRNAETVGWSDCGHNDYRPGTVLDPFFGSGTTGLVARKHGRRTIGIELSPDYAQMAARRLQQLSLLA